MSKKLEFDNCSITDIQLNFFMNELLDQDGEYYYRTNGMSISGQTLVLFQCSNKIIATAILGEIIKIDFDDVYKGKYCFDPMSIGIFEPISSVELSEVCNIKKLSQVKQIVEINKLDNLMKLLKEKNIIYSCDSEKNLNEIYFSDNDENSNYKDEAEDIDDKEDSLYRRKKRSQRYKYYAIKEANFNCEIDNLHKWFISKKTKENYVEGHHLIPIAYQNQFEYSIDIPANIVSLCPLCHKKLHHAELEEKEKMIKKMYEQKIERLNKCKIDISIEQLIQMYK